MRLELITLLLLPFLASAAQSEQMPMSNDIPEYTPQTHNGPTLADLLTIETSASIFYSYAREIELSRIFGDESMKTTVFVPTNKAVMALARKPHQGHDSATIDDGIQISEQEFDRLSKKNVERWVSAHIIPQSPISLSSSQTYPTLLEGRSITCTPVAKKDGGADWKNVVVDGNIHITGMREGHNGVLYFIDRTISVD